MCCSLLQIYSYCMVGVIYVSYTTTCLGLIILKILGLFGNYECLGEGGKCLSEGFNCLPDNNLALFLCLGIVVWNWVELLFTSLASISDGILSMTVGGEVV
ncbi:unnamed protein product [Vicia faba]|uniref:Transmembrane protein n=1 Tax=Vicia faba TaxID=3906 RepID=A0AAV1AY85_VICFA|nr:unnamed protein product [Vicia faba]